MLAIIPGITDAMFWVYLAAVLVVVVLATLYIALGIKYSPKRHRAQLIKARAAQSADEVREEKPDEEIAATVVQSTAAAASSVAVQETVVAQAITADLSEVDDETDETVARAVNLTFGVRNIRSFEARLIQLDGTKKAYYSQIKNELLSYKGVKVRLNKWKGEVFYMGRRDLAKLRIRGKNLYLYLNLDGQKLVGTKYHVKIKTEKAEYADTPVELKITSDRTLRYSAELIADVMDGIEKLPSHEFIDYASQYPYKKTEELIAAGLIKTEVR